MILYTLLILRYVSIEGEDNDKRMPIGKCTVIGSSMTGDDGVEKKTLYPCRLNSGLNLDSGSCQVRCTTPVFLLKYQYIVVLCICTMQKTVI